MFFEEKKINPTQACGIWVLVWRIPKGFLILTTFRGRTRSSKIWPTPIKYKEKTIQESCSSYSPSHPSNPCSSQTAPPHSHHSPSQPPLPLTARLGHLGEATNKLLAGEVTWWHRRRALGKRLRLTSLPMWEEGEGGAVVWEEQVFEGWEGE